MKMQDAKEYVLETAPNVNKQTSEELAELLIWAYDKGWSEGREDYREEQDPTEYQEFRRSR